MTVVICSILVQKLFIVRIVEEENRNFIKKNIKKVRHSHNIQPCAYACGVQLHFNILFGKRFCFFIKIKINVSELGRAKNK